MTPAALRTWLDSEDSQSVGMTHGGERVTHEGGEESVGHEMGRRILDLKAKRAAELDDGRLRGDAQGGRLRAPARQAAPGRRRDRHTLAQVADELGP